MLHVHGLIRQVKIYWAGRTLKHAGDAAVLACEGRCHACLTLTQRQAHLSCLRPSHGASDLFNHHVDLSVHQADPEKRAKCPFQRMLVWFAQSSWKNRNTVYGLEEPVFRCVTNISRGATFLLFFSIELIAPASSSK